MQIQSRSTTADGVRNPGLNDNTIEPSITDANNQNELAPTFDDLTVFTPASEYLCKLRAEALSLPFGDPAIAAPFPKNDVHVHVNLQDRR